MSSDRRAPLDPEQWKEVRALFDQCLMLTPDERARALADVAPWLRQEVESLLAKSTESEFLENPLLPEMARNASMEPRRAGKYLLVYSLGRGGMAEVFLARLQGAAGFERFVAVKRILGDDPEFRRLFEEEARLVSGLTHPNLVHVYDFEAHDDGYLLAMEYIHGLTLAQILKKGKLSDENAIYVVSKILAALEYAHQKGIVHRDIAPKNVMISYDGEVKVLDFGIARHVDRETTTQPGMLRGTFGYIPPEAITGGPVDARGDVYSAAVVLRETLDAAQIDPALEAILKKGLAENPQDRYASVAQMRLDLETHLTPGVAVRLAADLHRRFSREIEERRKVLDNAARDVKAPPRARPNLRLVYGGLSALLLAVGIYRFRTANDPCADDRDKFCRDAMPAQGALALCLKSVETQISPMCQAKINSIPLVANCGEDALKLCEGKSGFAVRRCLASQADSVSDTCRAAMELNVKKMLPNKK